MENNKPRNHEPQTAEEAIRMLDEIEAEIQQEIGADEYENIQIGKDSIKEYKQPISLTSNKKNVESQNQQQEGCQFLKQHGNTGFNINRPRLEDYNLTQEIYDNEFTKFQNEKNVINNSQKKGESLLLITGLLLFLFFIIGSAVFMRSNSNIVWIILIGSIIGYICFFRYEKNLEKNFKDSLDKVNDSIRETIIIQRYNKYLSDLKVYEAELAKFNKKIQMLREKYWIDMEGHKFEREIAALFSKFGYHTEVTKGSGDGGVDIILTKNNKKYYVQCKNHKNPVAPATARDLFGAMNHDGIKNGVIVSTMGFTKGVFKFVEGKDIKLISLKQILKMVDHIK